MKTLEDVKAEIADLIERNPDKVNPMNEYNQCLYDDGDGNSCIVGAWAKEQNLPLPKGNGGAAHVAEDMGWPVDDETRFWLDNLQQVADGKLILGLRHPLPWGLINLDTISSD